MKKIVDKPLKIEFLKWEFNELLQLCFNLQNHIIKLNNIYIIEQEDKNEWLDNLNKIVSTITDNYNEFILLIENEEEDENDIYIDELSELLYEDKLKHKLTKNSFPLIDKLVEDSGYSNLKFYLKFRYNINLSNNFSHYHFVPIKIFCNDETIEEDLLISFPNNKIHPLEKDIQVKIKYDNKTINIIGFYEEDPLNLEYKFHQLNDSIINQRKIQFHKEIKNTNIDNQFCEKFLKFLPSYYWLIYDVKKMISYIENQYQKFIELNNKSFMLIMKQFVDKENSVFKIYQIIFLLLLGANDNVNVASLLFSLTKEKKFDSKLIADLIYTNLPYLLQKKLKKGNIDLKKEMEKLKSISINDIDYKKQILAVPHMPEYVKATALEKVNEMKNSNSELNKQTTFVKYLLKYPWINPNDKFLSNLSSSQANSYLQKIENNLNQNCFGHKNAKNHIVELMGKWISNPDSSGSALALVGPPGVGKTLLARVLSKSLDIPFVQISLGGQNDGELLHGHGYTYSGAQPGLIVKKMTEAGNSRCIFYFDELDKATAKNGQVNEITSILIHLTDPNMNHEFQDRFFQGIDFPLNQVIFIFSYNDPSLVDPILLDRLYQIQVEPYSLKDKLDLTKQFLLKETSSNVGFKENEFNINDKTIINLIDNYTLEAGVRGLKKKLEKIFLKLNILKIKKEKPFDKKKNKINITNKLIEELLQEKPISPEKIHLKPEIGIVNGLYATALGSGGIVPIQIYPLHHHSKEKFTLKLTGHQGKVMKESVHCSLTTALNYLERNKKLHHIDDLNLYMDENFKNGFHIHAPSGATPKDGPSAGIAFTLAFISCILKKPIDNKIAMTGEIDLTGKVNKIGGLLYKIMGAKKAGIKKILICQENKDDLDNIKKDNPDLINHLDFKIIKVIDDVVKEALNI
jgi:endopeptidase La